jgi:V/A-type H+-transporting ATPase subunit K
MECDTALGIVGAIVAMAFGAFGSAFGTGAAAASAIGAWKKCYAQGKQAPFILLSYVGAPITQTLYGMIVMFTMIGIIKSPDVLPGSGLAMLLIGIFAGSALGLSAWLQGRAGAAAADAQAESGSGLSNNLSALGIIETVAIFTMVFTLIAVGNLKVEKAPAGASSAELPAATVQSAE